MSCNCFGALAPSTISRQLAYRNLALGLGVGALLLTTSPQAVSAIPVAELVAIVGLGWFAIMGREALKFRAAANHGTTGSAVSK